MSPFRGATDTPVLDFWWCLPWVSKPGWIPCLLSRLCFVLVFRKLQITRIQRKLQVSLCLMWIKSINKLGKFIGKLCSSSIMNLNAILRPHKSSLKHPSKKPFPDFVQKCMGQVEILKFYSFWYLHISFDIVVIVQVLYNPSHNAWIGPEIIYKATGAEAAFGYNLKTNPPVRQTCFWSTILNDDVFNWPFNEIKTINPTSGGSDRTICMFPTIFVFADCWICCDKPAQRRMCFTD